MTNLKEIIEKFGTPLYIYEEDKIRENYDLIDSSIPYLNKQIHYAVMCNSNKGILKIIRSLGGSVQINSLHEMDLVREVGFTKDQISFTSTGLDTESLQRLIVEGIRINLDSVEEIEKYCKLNHHGKFGIRIKMKEDIKLPEKHTNSPRDSDIGIPRDNLDKVKEIAKQYACKINGIHGYLASNILELEPFIQASDYLVKFAKQFPDLEYVNFGSGFGVPNKPEEQRFDFKGIGKHYSNLTQKLSGCYRRSIQLKVEPGRSLIATAGTLYAKVTNVKQLKGKKQVIIDAGYAEFARSRLYGVYHEIQTLEKRGRTELCDVRANTVLQSDFLGKAIQLPILSEGNIVAIQKTGAYGRVMASGFPGKSLPKELIIHSDKTIELAA